MSLGVRKHLQGFLNPFASTGGSKIPDGAVQSSLPLTHRLTTEIRSSLGPLITLIMYPGLQSGLFYDRQGLSAIEKNFPYTNDSWLEMTGTRDVSGINDLDVTTGGGVARWRLVSQALKLTLLNTDHENDGWFESARISYKPRMTDWKLNSPIGNHADLGAGNTWETSGSEAFFSADGDLASYLNNRNLTESPSYVAGSLKDISKHQFNLLPFDKVNSFIELQEAYKMTEDEFLPLLNAQPGTTYQEIPLVDGASSSKSIYNSMMDTNHDLVIIRIHPGLTECKLLGEMAVNQEVVYDIDSTLAKHMTPTENDEAGFKVAQTFKNASNARASTVVSMEM